MTAKAFQPENHLSDTDSRWFAVYTKFRSEKDVVKRLARKGIEAYTPINQVVRQYKRKRKVVDLPLINSYVFVKITKDQYIKVLETEYVHKFISFSKNLISIPEEEITLLKRICQEISEIETENVPYQDGKPVEIISGNLTGIQGKLIADLGKNFLVELEYIGIGLRLEVYPKYLKPLPGVEVRETRKQAPALRKKYWG
ncbi:MAG: UpxY family transcription antiterminator [Saprospiraceae bacterium]|nr:UpxY family transcription antiterminator [Saprospiraceae bacterium]